MDGRRVDQIGHEEVAGQQTQHVHLRQMDIGDVVGAGGCHVARGHCEAVDDWGGVEGALFGRGRILI